MTGQRMTTAIIFDLSTLRFRRVGENLVIISATGEELAVYQDAPADRRVAAAAALEDALARARVWRHGEPCPLAWYHPETAEVSLGAYPGGLVLGAGQPLELAACGSPAQVTVDGLTLDGVTLLRVVPTY